MWVITPTATLAAPLTVEPPVWNCWNGCWGNLFPLPFSSLSQAIFHSYRCFQGQTVSLGKCTLFTTKTEPD